MSEQGVLQGGAHQQPLPPLQGWMRPATAFFTWAKPGEQVVTWQDHTNPARAMPHPQAEYQGCRELRPREPPGRCSTGHSWPLGQALPT